MSIFIGFKALITKLKSYKDIKQLNGMIGGYREHILKSLYFGRLKDIMP